MREILWFNNLYLSAVLVIATLATMSQLETIFKVTNIVNHADFKKRSINVCKSISKMLL